jgi:hypothetical protein
MTERINTEAKMRATLYTAIAAATAAFALGSGTLAGQRAHSDPEGAVGSNPAHTHIAHVMSMWKDTPNMQGFLPVAVDDAKVAATRAALMQKSPANLDSMKLHAGHVLHGLDPTLEAKGSGYGVKRAAAGALQHIQLAAKSEGASQNVQTHTGHVSASLSNVIAWRRPGRCDGAEAPFRDERIRSGCLGD